MINHTIQSAALLQTANAFKNWLALLGYAPSVQTNNYAEVKEFFHFLEQRNIYNLENISALLINDYIQYLEHRPNQRRAGGLSNAYINQQIAMLKKLARYLWNTQKIILPVHTRYKVRQNTPTLVLNHQQIREFYHAAQQTWPRLILRNRTMIDLLYACGLRRNEAIKLDIPDIDLKSRRLHVRFGKRYQQRYVVFTQKIADRFSEYLRYGRPLLDRAHETPAFLLSLKGHRMVPISVYSCITKIRNKCTDPVLKYQPFGAHTLRHSIATHLHQAGMPIHQIKNFLGHQSIESTQIYTHLSTDKKE